MPRLAGYEDVNDADRLGGDPATRWGILESECGWAALILVNSGSNVSGTPTSQKTFARTATPGVIDAGTKSADLDRGILR